MADPTPLPATNASKITLFYNQGIQGWSEVYYFVSTSRSIDLPMQASATLSVARKGVLNVTTRQVGTRISWESSPQSAFPYDKNNGAGFAGTTITAELSAKSWLLSYHDISGQYKRKGWIHGMLTSWNTWLPTRPDVPTPAPLMLSAFTNFQTTVGNIDFYTRAFGSFCIKALSKELADTLPKKIASVAANTTDLPGYWDVSVIGGTYAIGDRIRVQKNVGCNIKGLNGPAIVQLAPPAVLGVQTITIDRKVCCPGGVVQINKKGQVVNSVYRYFPISSLGDPNNAALYSQGVTLQRIATKRVGRPFTGTVGRRRNKCC